MVTQTPGLVLVDVLETSVLLEPSWVFRSFENVIASIVVPENVRFAQPGHRRIGGDPNRAELETCSPAIQIGLLGRAIKEPQGVAFHN